MTTAKVGSVGVGRMGQCAHLKNYVTIPGCEVVAIAEPREELGRRVAARYGVPRVYRDHKELLAAEELDGIVASQPFGRHGIIVPDLLKVGVPVFTEKPLACSIEAGEKIVEAARDSGTWLMVGYHKRSDPATMYAKSEIDQLKETGELGDLRYVRILMPAGNWGANGFTELITTDDPMSALEVDPPASDMDTQAYGQYTSFVNYYIHQVNLMRHLLGEPYTVTYADPSGVLIAVQSDSGVAGTIEMSPYNTTIDWQEAALVCFTHGYVRLALPAPLASNRAGRVEIFKDPGGEITPIRSIPTLPWIHAMREQAMNFVRAIRSEMEPMCTSEEALEDLKVARQYIELIANSQ